MLQRIIHAYLILNDGRSSLLTTIARCKASNAALRRPDEPVITVLPIHNLYTKRLFLWVAFTVRTLIRYSMAAVDKHGLLEGVVE